MQNRLLPFDLEDKDRRLDGCQFVKLAAIEKILLKLESALDCPNIEVLKGQFEKNRRDLRQLIDQMSAVHRSFQTMQSRRAHLAATYENLLSPNNLICQRAPCEK